jgi:hypothetical protein
MLMTYPLIAEAARKLQATYARVTFAAHDMNAFAELGRITVDQWHAATAEPQNLDYDNSVILDLMQDEWTIADEKFVSAETVAALLGWPVAEVTQRGRQAVARQLDEEREYLSEDLPPRGAIGSTRG